MSTQLQYTPRKFVIHPETNNLIVIETDHNAYTEDTKQMRKQQMAEEMVEAAGEEEQQLAAEMAAAFLNERLPEDTFGAPKVTICCVFYSTYNDVIVRHVAPKLILFHVSFIASPIFSGRARHVGFINTDYQSNFWEDH